MARARGVAASATLMRWSDARGRRHVFVLSTYGSTRTSRVLVHMAATAPAPSSTPALLQRLVEVGVRWAMRCSRQRSVEFERVFLPHLALGRGCSGSPSSTERPAVSSTSLRSGGFTPTTIRCCTSCHGRSRGLLRLASTPARDGEFFDAPGSAPSCRIRARGGYCVFSQRRPRTQPFGHPPRHGGFAVER